MSWGFALLRQGFTGPPGSLHGSEGQKYFFANARDEAEKSTMPHGKLSKKAPAAE
jgi:hypothetical protein